MISSEKIILNCFIEERKMKLIVHKIFLVSTVTVICVAAALFIAHAANSATYIGL